MWVYNLYVVLWFNGFTNNLTTSVGEPTIISDCITIQKAIIFYKPKNTLFIMNDYYQGLLNDNNTTLAVQDLVSRDEEIAQLKAQVEELNGKVYSMQNILDAQNMA